MKILVWCRWLDDILYGTKPPDGIGGAEVQMAMWAKTCVDFNNKVFTFSWRSSFFLRRNYGIFFLPLPWIRKIGFLFSPLKYLYILLIRPDVIIIRSNSDLSNILWFKSKINFKLIFMYASDKDLQTQNLNNIESWQSRLFNVDLVVTQNIYQSKVFKDLFPGVNTVMQPNIFHPIFDVKVNCKKYDFIWVATLNSNKRPKWFLNLAKSLPNYKFAMVGFGYENQLLKEVLDSESELLNLKYFGYCSLEVTLNIIASSKVLINTSIYEGFPNVFLQAWSFGMPVISTVDPNFVFTKYNLGFFVETEKELVQSSNALFSDPMLFNETVERIRHYFFDTHNPEIAYHKIFNKLFNN